MRVEHVAPPSILMSIHLRAHFSTLLARDFDRTSIVNR